MKYVLAVAVFFLLVVPAQAFNPVLTDVEQPYEIITIEERGDSTQEYLGELTGFPVMYEVTSDEPFTLQARLQQRYQPAGEPIDFSVIVIRKNERGGGVSEVARLQSSSTAWTRNKSSRLGMSVWESSALVADVQSGTYQIEVSTPDNLGKYLLYFGSEDVSGGYFQSLTGIYRTQKFFGFSPMSMLLSSYVYYPLGIILLLYVGHKIWKYRKLISADVS
jgi:hypothetical protein